MNSEQGAIITVSDVNGRIDELERQRNEALRRCSILAGERAQVLDVLRQAQAEIARLNALVNGLTAGHPSTDETEISALN